MENKTMKSKVMKAAAWLAPRPHERYREYCVLAATGQLGGAQMSELNHHVGGCDACRDFLETIVQASAMAMPQLHNTVSIEAEKIAPPEGMGARFLARLADEELRPAATTDRHQPVVIRQSASTFGNASAKCRTLDRKGDPRTTPPSFRWYGAAALLACIGIGFGGFYAGTHRGAQIPQLAAQANARVALINNADHPSELEREKSDLEKELALLQGKLLESRSQQQAVMDRIADSNSRIAALAGQSQDERSRLVGENQAAASQIDILQKDNERLRGQLDDSKSKLAAQQRETDSVSARLEATEGDLDREREMGTAGGGIGELVAARNLHIIDVYDSDNKGKRQRSFGRVFYIEGKSLVFYAYDLGDQRRSNVNMVFRVWGEKTGIKETTISLGMLQNDDPNQSRWVMTYDDPKILGQINSVFVTAEVAGKQSDEPRGRKVLYAYFGSQPNHP
jgi:hypothetical protein